jgi:hypothetical protein
MPLAGGFKTNLLNREGEKREVVQRVLNKTIEIIQEGKTKQKHIHKRER